MARRTRHLRSLCRREAKAISARSKPGSRRRAAAGWRWLSTLDATLRAGEGTVESARLDKMMEFDAGQEGTHIGSATPTYTSSGERAVTMLRRSGARWSRGEVASGRRKARTAQRGLRGCEEADGSVTRRRKHAPDVELPQWMMDDEARRRPAPVSGAAKIDPTAAKEIDKLGRSQGAGPVMLREVDTNRAGAATTS